jgi:DNA polymerase-3 subunit delta'
MTADWDILGHEWAAKMLAQHIAQGEARHAYLFTGPPGVGRRTLALRFVQALNCPQPPAPGQPCRQCRTCQQIERQQHPDLTVVQSEQEGATLKVDQVRELQRTLSLAPFQSRYRIALLLRFQEATANSQNALLKTLEEAPEKVILLLTADTAESLLPTIASRCEVLRLRPLRMENLVEALQTRWGQSPQQAARLAHLAGGRTGYALRMVADPTLIDRRQAWLDDLHSLLQAPLRQRFSYADRATHPREKTAQLPELYRTWLSFWRDMLLVAAGAETPLTNLAQESEIRRLAEQVGLEEVRTRTAALERALAQLNANVNPRLLTEVLLLDWPLIR